MFISDELDMEKFYDDCENSMKKLSRSHRSLISLIESTAYKSCSIKELIFEDTLLIKKSKMNQNNRHNKNLLS